MHEVGSFLLPDLGSDGIPLGDAGLLLLLVVLVLVLEAVVGQVHHKLLLALDVLFVVLLDGEAQIPWVEQHDVGLAIYQHVASDIEFASVDEQGPNVLLYQSVMLQVCVLAGLLTLLLLRFLQHVGLVVQHIIERVLPQVELLRLDELLLELVDVRDHSDAPALIQVAGLVDPQPFALVVQERDLVRHDI